ncbi:MAG: alpha/beta fold hydrolase [Microcystis aeruginosa Ma_MB_F_20061100_S20]|uniref:Alpha/beta fold hydrolase n=1 Tax=Microcystis aeruginosa Ma_MB_F_20061100_S20D TaxID=2486253 RepID=A0A552ELD7_MICAE|nr:MAG: alpha/beta fold hydrolase [Microcystis aeruginosa Ma_MB_F_20061100_S20D]TRU43320.1 MAG: alpha/beta fold hydrolase [Microcystis aeruginosa Ma_MB_F_20061100_S20]
MNTAALTIKQNWQWQGHSIHYVQGGTRVAGKPPLLLVHGFGASTDHWRKNLQGLASEWEVWAIDLLGFGRSAKPDLVYSGSLWQQQLNDFIKEVVGQPTVLAGNSLGGYASLCLAANHSENVRGLILLNSAGPFSDTESNRQPNLAQKLLRSILLQPWASYLLFLYTRQPKTIRKTLEKVYLDRSAITEELIEDIRRPSLDAGAAKVFASVFKSPRGENVDILLQKLSCPLLMLWGEGDPWMNTRERGSKFRQYYPSLTEYYLTAGHCPHDEIPTEVNQLISDWMKSL